MTAPAAELQRVLFEALNGDAFLSAALGGTRLFEHAQENVLFPYMTFGRTSTYDWTTGKENEAEQLFTLHVWSKADGNKETVRVMDLVRARLEDAALALDEHRRAALRLEFSEVRYDDDLLAYHGLLRFRAVTEQTT